MGLFRHNIHNDTILCVEYIRANLDSGLETIVVGIGQQRFGRISQFFRRVSKREEPIKDSLEKKARSAIDPCRRKLILALLKGKITDLDRLRDRALEDKRNEITVLTRRVGVVSNVLVLIPLAPVAILLGELVQGSFADFQQAVGTGSGFPFPDSVKLLILAVCAIVALVSVLLLRVRR